MQQRLSQEEEPSDTTSVGAPLWKGITILSLVWSINIQFSFRPDTGRDSPVQRKFVTGITLDQSWLGWSQTRNTWGCRKAPVSLPRRHWCTFPSTPCSIAGSTRFYNRNVNTFTKHKEELLKRDVFIKAASSSWNKIFFQLVGKTKVKEHNLHEVALIREKANVMDLHLENNHQL